ncbi:MAG TPA: hypothetical protein VLI05_04655 [Candidatus Saccharimonadia bacterium]|nr:hypothetical protein [Candidatus Saccharimonadia bacterium]
MTTERAVWICGLHTNTIGWKDLLWGDPEQQQLGSLPMAILCALNHGLKSVAFIGMGSGASHRSDGRAEADAVRELLLLRRDELIEFDAIRDHRELADRIGQSRLDELLDAAVTDTSSQDPQQEIAAAARLATAHNVTSIALVANGCLAPDIARQVAMARCASIIPGHQTWSVTPDHMALADTDPSSTLIFTHPHRGDDRLCSAELRPHEVFGGFFRLNLKNQAYLLECTRRFIAKHGA